MAIAHFAKLEHIMDNAFSDIGIESLSPDVVNGPVPPADPETVFSHLELKDVTPVMQNEEMLSTLSSGTAADNKK